MGKNVSNNNGSAGICCRNDGMPEKGGEGRFGGEILKRELPWPGPNAEFNVGVDFSFNQ